MADADKTQRDETINRTRQQARRVALPNVGQEGKQSLCVGRALCRHRILPERFDEVLASQQEARDRDVGLAFAVVRVQPAQVRRPTRELRKCS